MSEDYEEIVEGTIDDVKEAVEEQDLDLERLLEAEEANKNRVTLVEWLEERIGEQTAEDFEEVVAEAQERADSGDGEKGFLKKLVGSITSKFFVSGLALGVVLTAAAFTLGLVPAGGTGASVSPSAAGTQAASYIADSSDAIEDVSVKNVEEIGGTGLYRTTFVMSASVLNRTVEQEQSAIVTSDGRYLLLGQLIDTTEPLSGQITQTAGTGQ